MSATWDESWLTFQKLYFEIPHLDVLNIITSHLSKILVLITYLLPSITTGALLCSSNVSFVGTWVCNGQSFWCGGRQEETTTATTTTMTTRQWSVQWQMQWVRQLGGGAGARWAWTIWRRGRRNRPPRDAVAIDGLSGTTSKSDVDDNDRWEKTWGKGWQGGDHGLLVIDFFLLCDPFSHGIEVREHKT